MDQLIRFLDSFFCWVKNILTRGYGDPNDSNGGVITVANAVFSPVFTMSRPCILYIANQGVAANQIVEFSFNDRAGNGGQVGPASSVILDNVEGSFFIRLAPGAVATPISWYAIMRIYNR